MRQRLVAPAYILAVMLAAELALAPPAQAAGEPGFSLDDFQVETTQDLLDICTLERGHPSHFEAQAFCYGYFQGGADFHQALAAGPEFQPIACPTSEVTVRDVVATFVAYARAHPEYLDERPMDTAFRAVSAEWPCQ